MALPIKFEKHYDIEPPRIPLSQPEKYQYDALVRASVGAYSDATRYNLEQYSSLIQDDVFDIARQLLAGESIVELKNHVTSPVFEQIMDCIDLDFPELFLGSKAKMNLINGKVASAEFDRISEGQLIRAKTCLSDVVSEIRKECTNMTELDSAREIYNYIVKIMSFTTEVDPSDSSAACIVGRRGNSYGISRLFQYICNELKIRCITKKFVLSNKYVNYLNCVLVNERWGNVDCSMAIEMRNGDITMGYFCFPDVYLADGVIAGQKPPCRGYENMNFYRFGGLLFSEEGDLQAAYKHVANCYLAGLHSADFLFVAENARKHFDAISNSLGFGAARYLETFSFDIRSTNTSYYRGVPICRLNFTATALPRRTIALQFSTWNANISGQLSQLMQPAIKSGFRTLYLIFGDKSNYQTMEETICANMFKILGDMKDVESIANFNYCGHHLAKVFELQL